MARAETIETLGETGGRGNGPLSHHSTCCMELPRPFHSWHGLPTTITTGSATSTGPMHPCHNHSHNLQPLQALYVSYPLPYSPPESQDEPQTHQQLPTLSPSLSLPLSPLCNQREEVDAGFSGEQSDSEREENQEAYSRRGPLPDLLPQNEHPFWVSPHHRIPTEGAVQYRPAGYRRMARRLRAIGDELNDTVLRRAHAVPHWQDWRDACRGLLNFIAQTLSTLYRLT